ncbi:MAG: hypothetical protein SPI49_03560 [Eubacteriales bacterium]|nr:hypothetical protein [Eubacteriales bacterium]
MGTNIRPKISENNKYFISKHRYYELKHFVMQYNEWNRELEDLDGYYKESSSVIERIDKGQTGNPTEHIAERRKYLSDRVQMVEECLDEEIGKQMLQAIIEDISYEKMNAKNILPCSKDAWYTAYRRFFWLLDKKRR